MKTVYTMLCTNKKNHIGPERVIFCLKVTMKSQVRSQKCNRKLSWTPCWDGQKKMKFLKQCVFCGSNSVLFMPCKFSLDILQSNEKNEVTKQAAKNALT